MEEIKKDVLVIAGPTASGKTAIAVELAKRYNGEVISADSMQVYKGMDIATAKPTKEEMQGIPHHLIDFVERDKAFSVAEYVILANEKIAEVLKRGKLPIIAGGTGLYISSLVDNIKFEEIKSDLSLRKKLSEEARIYGNESLLKSLKLIDPETAETLHSNNLARIIRGIEVFELTGKKLSELKEASRLEPSPYNFLILGLNYIDRQFLYSRIDRRVDIMIETGLIEECKAIYENSEMKTAHQAIGYKELIPFFENRETLAECIAKIKQYTRNYAKRQLTWFRKDNRIIWINVENTDVKEKILKKSEKIIANSKIV